MQTPTRILLGTVAALALAFPGTAVAADAELTAHLDYLSRNGRWEQVLEVISRTDPTDPDLAPFKLRADNEITNLYRFLRVRNAHKRKDFGTAILVARGIDADSVYRARADQLVDGATQRFGPEETQRAARASDRMTRRAQLDLVLALRPGFGPAESALSAPVADSPRRKAPSIENSDAPVEVPEGEPASAVEPVAGPMIASADNVVSLDDLGAPPARDDTDVREAVDAGRAAADKGDLPAAASLLRDAVSMDPNHAPAYLHLGVVEHARGNRKDAVDAFKVYLRLAPDDPKAAQLLAYVRDNSASQGGLDARQCMAEASKSSGEGNLEGAIAWLHKAAVADPVMPEPWLQLGMMLERVGRADNARKAYGRYLELAPEGAFAQNARAGIDRLK